MKKEWLQRDRNLWWRSIADSQEESFYRAKRTLIRVGVGGCGVLLLFGTHARVTNVWAWPWPYCGRTKGELLSALVSPAQRHLVWVACWLHLDILSTDKWEKWTDDIIQFVIPFYWFEWMLCMLPIILLIWNVLNRIRRVLYSKQIFSASLERFSHFRIIVEYKRETLYDNLLFWIMNRLFHETW